jgi:hypothetical protein
VPIQIFLAKVTRLGPFPFQVEGGGGYFVARPRVIADLELVATAAFPEREADELL